MSVTVNQVVSGGGNTSATGGGGASGSGIVGTYDITTFAGVTTGVLGTSAARQANGIALQSALNYCATNSLFATAGAVTLQYEATQVENSINVGLQVPVGCLGLLCYRTKFIQFSVNYAALTLGSVSTNPNDQIANAIYQGFSCGYGVSQAGQTQATGLLLGRIWVSSFANIGVIPNISGSVFHPYVGLKVGDSLAQFFFNNTLDNIAVNGGQLNFLQFNANSTGNVWGAVYLGGGTVGNRTTLSDAAFKFTAQGSAFGTIAQLNIEWSVTFQAMSVDTCRVMDIDVLYFEGNKMAASGFAPVMLLNIGSVINIRAARGLNNWNDVAFSTNPLTLFQTYGPGRTEIDSVYFSWDGGTELVATGAMLVLLTDLTALGNYKLGVKVKKFTVDGAGYTGSFGLSSTYTAAAYGNLLQFGEYNYEPGLSRTEDANILLPSGAGPQTVYGLHKYAQITLNTAIAADRKTLLSVNQSASGAGSTTPRVAGDTMTFVRGSAATGAFNWLIRDSTDTTTLATLATINTTATLTWTGLVWA